MPIQVETAPGEAAQVDFGYVGRLYDPTQGVVRRTWPFVPLVKRVLTLGLDLAPNPRRETFLAGAGA